MVDTQKVLDTVIIGAGPAGLTAGIYAQRALLSNVILEQEAVGGQIVLTDTVDNYPGIPHANGYTLADSMRKQAEDLGAKIVSEQAVSITRDPETNLFTTKTAEKTYVSKILIVAGGATPRKAGFEGEDQFAGHGVSYCATCDAMFYRNKPVYVVGGGNSAAEEALFLTKFASKVIIVIRKDHMRAQASVQRQLEENDKVEIRYLTSVVKLEGNQLATEITLKHNDTQDTYSESYEEGGFGVFVFVGRVPATNLIKDMVDVDDHGYVKSDETMSTKTPGLFVAGDIRQKMLRQIVTATADGAIAATSAAAYLGQHIAS
ncbi:MAG: FAD-binding protein [Coriobacteriaceae bacterium]|nr:MAG: FAD-binding protein [Coriobacteriaceae bacterium]